MSEWMPYPQNEPNDDECVLVTNVQVDKNLWGRAYYEKGKGFFAIDASHAIPLQVTHFLKIPQIPFCE